MPVPLALGCYDYRAEADDAGRVVRTHSHGRDIVVNFLRTSTRMLVFLAFF